MAQGFVYVPHLGRKMADRTDTWPKHHRHTLRNCPRSPQDGTQNTQDGPHDILILPHGPHIRSKMF